ncbi:MAG: hypothetical protein JWL83_219, partial [Actinomycetia bacterium]|nr:hypothetical protein [Actinomycetes bacterium]
MDRAALLVCEPDELTDALEQLHALECVTRSQLLELVRAMRAREDWKIDGASSLGEWVAIRLGIRVSVARDIVRVAAALEQLPKIAAVFATGAMSWDQLRALTYIATPDTDGQWAGDVSTLTVAG